MAMETYMEIMIKIAITGMVTGMGKEIIMMKVTILVKGMEMMDTM